MSKKELSYEEALLEIESIVKRFRQGDMSVDELAAQVEKATELIAYCKKRLHKAEGDLKEIFN